MSPRKQKWLAWSLIALALIGASTGAVFAYLSQQGGSVSNAFTPDLETNPSINETFTDNVKTNVSVNVGALDYAVYVRAAIVVTWQKTETVDGVEQVHVYGQLPVAGTDYSIDLNAGDSKPWFQQGDFYYYRQKVDSKEPNQAVLTDVLINSCKPLTSAPTGYSLHVEIIAQTIQAVGTMDGTDVPAVTDAWGIRIDGNGQLFNTVVAVTGDTWESLAEKYGVDKEDLATLNGKTSTNAITVGQTIILPNVP